VSTGVWVHVWVYQMVRAPAGLSGVFAEEDCHRGELLCRSGGGVGSHQEV